MQQIITIVVTVVLLIIILSQCRKPWGWPGRLFLWQMNRSHSGVTDWGLDHVAVETRDTILDVGCGGGRTVKKLAGMAASGKVFGIDYSKSSVAVARKTNESLINAGLVEILRSSVSALPFPDDSFDLVTAAETHYYWPDLIADMREVLRVLKPGGHLIIIAETYKGRRWFDLLFQLSMKILGGTSLTVGEHRQLFQAAGFSAIEIIEEPKKGWICCVGQKRSQKVGA